MIKVGQFSTWQEHCGVARNAHSVADLLGDAVEIVPLPLKRSTMLGKKDKFERQIANTYFDELIEIASQCDAIIWQHEPGLLGSRKKDYFKRSKLISKINKPMIIVLHTIPRELSFGDNAINLIKCLFSFPSRSTFVEFKENVIKIFRGMAWKRLFTDIARAVSRNGVLIIHTEEDAKYIKVATSIDSSKVIIAAPSNVTNEMKNLYLQISSSMASNDHNSRVQSIFNQYPDAFWITYVGFLNDYKGIDYLLEVIKLLPQNFRLIISGGIHERSADDFIDAHPFTKKILGLLGLTTNQSLDKIKVVSRKEEPSPSKVDLQNLAELRSRIHLLSYPSDIEIAETVIGSDAVSLLYRNVNQSASGPLVEALELGATTVASNNRLFRRFKNRSGEQLLLVDVGNTLQVRDEFIRLLGLRELHERGGYRFVKYPWTQSINFRERFKEGYSEAFGVLGFQEVKDKLN